MYFRKKLISAILAGVLTCCACSVTAFASQDEPEFTEIKTVQISSGAKRSALIVSVNKTIHTKWGDRQLILTGLKSDNAAAVYHQRTFFKQMPLFVPAALRSQPQHILDARADQ